MKKIIYFLVCFIIFFLITFSIMFYNSQKEYNLGFNFIIAKINFDSKRYLIFYDKNKEYMFANYLFTKKEGIQVGDKIIKTEKSKILYVYRKNFATDKYEIYLKKKPNGTFK